MLKYQQIARAIERHIVEQQLKQGDKLPVLERLMEQFDVSKSTIIKALEVLEQKGVVYQLRGSGIFVRRSDRPGFMNLFSAQGFKQTFEGMTLSARVLQLDVVAADDAIAEKLAIAVGSDVYRVKRVRYIEGKPLCIEQSYYNKAIVTYLNNEIVADSIFDYLESGLSLKIGFSDMYMTVSLLELEEAELLELASGSPALRMETVFHLTNGQPFDYSQLTYHYEQAKFVIPARGMA